MIATSLELGTLAMGLFGGLSVFLFGMEIMTDTLKSIAGQGMKRILARLTTNRFTGVLAGGFVTAVIQSSSVTTVLTVGFVSAGLVSLQQSIGVIMGAEIGTTITAQIIAFKVTKYSLLLVTIGFVSKFFSKRETVRAYGTMILGFGLIFFGMSLMKGAMKPLQAYEPFMATMQGLKNPLLGILFGALFTGLVQSSSATTAVIIALAGEGLIGLRTGIALAFGANIGTCVTALLASIGRPRVAVQTAFIHVCFNVLGVLLWFGFLDLLVEWVRFLSPAHADIDDPVRRAAAAAPRQIANAHTTFNIANTLIFIWFTPQFARLVRWVVPDRPEAIPAVIQPKFLDDILLETPDLAMDRVRMELGRMGERAYTMVEKALPAAAQASPEGLRALAKLDDDVDTLHAAIVSYCGRLSQQGLTALQSEQLADYMAIANHIESIGDMIETNIVRAGLERAEQGVHMSDETRKVLDALHHKVCWAVRHALEALRTANEETARETIEAKTEISRLADDAEHHLAHRLVAPEDDRVTLFRLESEIIEYLKRVYYFSKRIAKAIAEVKMAYLAEKQQG